MRFDYYEHKVSTSYEQKDAIGSAYFTYLPGNYAIGVIHGVYIPVAKRGNGTGKKQHKMRLDHIRQEFSDSVTHLMCTINNHNDAELRIVSAFGWERVADFGGASLWIKDLSKPDEPLRDDLEDVED